MCTEDKSIDDFANISDSQRDEQESCESLLKKYWGYDGFRGIQAEIIDSICQGRDTLGLMPTGGGKSITFQVPALKMSGTCIVVTPLIALMKDQIWHLRQMGINAVAVHSGMQRKEIIQMLENCILGDVKLLYLSPERLSSPLFLAKLKRINVSFITVDEAHCISQWGYDFRPSYLHIADLRRLKPDAPLLALTATATPEVVDDIQDRLMFKEHNVIRMSFERKNLSYVVRITDDKEGQLIHILNSVEGSAIVYTRSRRNTVTISQILNVNGISATYFHAGLETSQKDERQNKWQKGDYRVIVATNAFGMGIDKPDVRLVIHVDCPDSLEAYFQEAGRAGRDGRKSYAVLLYNGSDGAKLKRRVSEKFPDKKYIRDVYEHLAYFYQIAMGCGVGRSFIFDVEKFCKTYKYFPVQAVSSVKLLAQCGYIRYEEEADSSARVRFLLERDDLYRLKDNPPDEDAVITGLLRNYSGLFSDYENIDENLIASQCSLTVEQVYLVLKGLSHRHIIHFIPRRTSPLITYIQRREEAEDIAIHESVYEIRKEQYKRQVAYIIKYATENDVCRSIYLLRYFGEKSDRECGSCDVCLDKKPERDHRASLERCKKMILQLVDDGEKHPITEIKKITQSFEELKKALCELSDERIIISERDLFWKGKI
jgi:ATP-dependent DNA helicase RecQ